MKRVTACVASFLLAFSMIGTPGLAWADRQDDEVLGDATQTETQQETNSKDLPAVSQSNQPSDESEADRSGVKSDDSTDSPDQGVQGISQADPVAVIASDSHDGEGADPSTDGLSGGAIDVKLTSFVPHAALSANLTAQLNTSDGNLVGSPVKLEPRASVVASDDQPSAVSAGQDGTEASIEAMRQSGASFCELPKGTYELTVSGKGYGTYVHRNIVIGDGVNVTLSLVDSLVADTDLEQDGLGLMPYGDFNVDGCVDDDDASSIATAVSQGSTDVATYDMNGDGMVDMKDVQFLATTLNAAKEGVLAKERVTIDASQMEAEIDEGTLLTGEGDVEDLLTDNGKTVQLQSNTKQDEPISDVNPVSVSIETHKAEMAGFTIQSPIDSQGALAAGKVEVESDLGTFSVSFTSPQAENKPIGPEMALMGTEASDVSTIASGATAEVNTDNGQVVIDFGRRVAVKKIKIKVTATTDKNSKLAEIAQVEFLNDMEDRIQPPKMSVPTDIKVTEGSEDLAVSWKPQTNITGYEFQISDQPFSDTAKATVETMATATPSVTVTSFKRDKLSYDATYYVRVRSVNGEWRSSYSEAKTAKLAVTDKPTPPENVSITGGFSELTVSWKQVKTADEYTVHYAVKGSNDWKSDEHVKGTRHVIRDLKANTPYEVYLTAVNKFGPSDKSKTYEGSTINVNVKVPYFNLINRTTQDSHLESGIESVRTDSFHTLRYPANDYNPMMVVDGNYSTVYHAGNSNGTLFYATTAVNFTKPHTMNQFALTTYLGSGYGSIAIVNVTTTDESGHKVTYGSGGSNASVTWTSIPSAPNTIMVTFPKTENVKSISVYAQRYYYDPMTISELAFYDYDPLLDEIDGLWADELHLTLRDGVNQETLNDLYRRLEETDPQGQNEKRWNLDTLKTELDNAQAVLNEESLSPVLDIDTSISERYDAHIESPGKNAWQPLGLVAKAGDSLRIYVRGEGKALGSSTELSLIATQYHAEVSHWMQTVVSNLRVGVNDVVIPNVSNLGREQGGSLYIQYTGNNPQQRYAVRVTGGNEIPVLDIHGVTDPAMRQAKAQAYVNQLQTYVDGLETAHAAAGHSPQYDPRFNIERECILNSTEIVFDTMMYSIPATQALAGCGGDADKLLTSLDAMDEMMDLFYQYKGYGNLTAAEQETYGTANALPKTRQNIRYMVMFTGAFMYAGGKHIGVEYPETDDLTGCGGLIADDQGKYQSGNYFGWGFAHEIGHEINQGCYTVAEITNNFYSSIAQAKDTDDSNRFKYEDVFAKVTSGAKGQAPNIGTQIAVYWQLHLAYDPGYNFTTYATFTENFNNRIFARMDAYARNQSLAPQPQGVPLTLKGADTDNALMRLAVAGAQMNNLAYFEAWGMTPDATTLAYAAQFPEETRPIQYISDEARAYRNEGGQPVADQTTVHASLDYAKGTQQVTIHLSHEGGDSNGLQGYEICRNGQPIAFVKADQTEYVDTIATMNNRVFTYSVTGVDKLLNRTQPMTLAPIKVSHDGALAKSGWQITTNMHSADDQEHADDEATSPCEQPPSKAIDQAIDGQLGTVFTGNSTEASAGQASNDPFVMLTFDQVQSVAALKYTAGDEHAITKYLVEVSTNGVDWQVVQSGSFTLDENHQATVYFNKNDDPWMYVYDASYVRLTAVGQQTVSIAELDILGPTGDDIEFIANGIGTLAEDLLLSPAAVDLQGQQVEEDRVPAGTLVFTGTYKGDPAYNAIKFYNEHGDLLPGTQVLFAEVPEQGQLGETSEGTWLWYMDQDDIAVRGMPTQVRAELYRVDDAHSLQGERLVAETLTTDVPSNLPSVKVVTETSSEQAEPDPVDQGSRVDSASIFSLGIQDKGAGIALLDQGQGAAAEEPNTTSSINTLSLPGTVGTDPQVNIVENPSDSDADSDPDAAPDPVVEVEPTPPHEVVEPTIPDETLDQEDADATDPQDAAVVDLAPLASASGNHIPLTVNTIGEATTVLVELTVRTAGTSLQPMGVSALTSAPSSATMVFQDDANLSHAVIKEARYNSTTGKAMVLVSAGNKKLDQDADGSTHLGYLELPSESLSAGLTVTSYRVETIDASYGPSLSTLDEEPILLGYMSSSDENAGGQNSPVDPVIPGTTEHAGNGHGGSTNWGGKNPGNGNLGGGESNGTNPDGNALGGANAELDDNGSAGHGADQASSGNGLAPGTPSTGSLTDGASSAGSGSSAAAGGSTSQGGAGATSSGAEGAATPGQVYSHYSAGDLPAYIVDSYNARLQQGDANGIVIGSDQAQQGLLVAEGGNGLSLSEATDQVSMNQGGWSDQDTSRQYTTLGVTLLAISLIGGCGCAYAYMRLRRITDVPDVRKDSND